MLVLLILARVSGSRRLRQRTFLGDSCLEIAGSDGIRSCAWCTHVFSRPFGFTREQREALLSVAITRQRSMMKSEAENVMESETSGLVIVVRIFATVRNWLGDLEFIAVVCKWGRELRRSVQSYLSW
jgi:hypothetical protein